MCREMLDMKPWRLLLHQKHPALQAVAGISGCFHVRRHCISFALERLCLVEALQLWQGTMLQVLLAQHFFCAI